MLNLNKAVAIQESVAPDVLEHIGRTMIQNRALIRIMTNTGLKKQQERNKGLIEKSFRSRTRVLNNLDGADQETALAKAESTRRRKHSKADVELSRLKKESRICHLAIGFLSEQPYRDIENRVRPGNEPSLRDLTIAVSGSPRVTEHLVEFIQEWLESDTTTVTHPTPPSDIQKLTKEATGLRAVLQLPSFKARSAQPDREQEIQARLAQIELEIDAATA